MEKYIKNTDLTVFINNLLDEKDIERKELAKILGVSYSNIKLALSRGKISTKRGRLKTRLKILKLLGFEAEDAFYLKKI